MSEPLSAWDPAGPDTPHPDVKVAGIALAELPREELPEHPVSLAPAYPDRPAPSRVFVIGAVATLVAVVCASFVAVATSGGEDGKAPNVQAVQTLVPQQNPKVDDVKVDPKKDAELRKDRAAEAAADDKAPRLRVKAAPTESPESDPNEGAGPPVAPGTAQAIAKGMLSGQGWDAKSQFGCLYNLWMRESGWRTTAGRVNGPYGIPQANPGTKMSSAGPKWKTDAATQIKWGLGYIKGRYKTPCGAWGHFQAKHWY